MLWQINFIKVTILNAISTSIFPIVLKFCTEVVSKEEYLPVCEYGLY